MEQILQIGDLCSVFGPQMCVLVFGLELKKKKRRRALHGEEDYSITTWTVSSPEEPGRLAALTLLGM